jgi:DNA-binding transcriptional LysR family regulator
MNSQKLYYLSVIIEQGSLRKAAEHLAMSQPALSKSMERLEATLNVKILERTSRGVSPTDVGEVLYSHARLIREDMDRARHVINQSTSCNDPVESITFGTLPTLVSSVVPRAVGAWREEDTRTKLKVVEKVQSELLLDLLRGHIDFIVARTEYYDLLEGFRQRVLFRDNLKIFAAASHPIFRHREPGWTDLVKYPWVCTMTGQQRNMLQHILDQKQLGMPEEITECTSIDFMISLVAHSDHLAILPSYIRRLKGMEDSIASVPLSYPKFARDIAVIFRSSHPLAPQSRALLAHIEAIGNEMARQDGVACGLVLAHDDSARSG